MRWRKKGRGRRRRRKKKTKRKNTMRRIMLGGIECIVEGTKKEVKR